MGRVESAASVTVLAAAAVAAAAVVAVTVLAIVVTVLSIVVTVAAAVVLAATVTVFAVAVAVVIAVAAAPQVVCSECTSQYHSPQLSAKVVFVGNGLSNNNLEEWIVSQSDESLSKVQQIQTLFTVMV
jgi:hypothetical protein